MKRLHSFFLLSSTKCTLVLWFWLWQLLVQFLTDAITICVSPSVTHITAHHGKIRLVIAIHFKTYWTEVAIPEKSRAGNAQGLQKLRLFTIDWDGKLMFPLRHASLGARYSLQAWRTHPTFITDPPANRDLFQSHTKAMVATVALVTEQHLVFIMGVIAEGTPFALHALPGICFDDFH